MDALERIEKTRTVKCNFFDDGIIGCPFTRNPFFYSF